MTRAGLTNIHPERIGSEHDTRIARLAGKADRVLVDAPCSGLGTLRRNPDLKYRQSAETVAKLLEQQHSILDAASKLGETARLFGLRHLQRVAGRKRTANQTFPVRTSRI